MDSPIECFALPALTHATAQANLIELCDVAFCVGDRAYPADGTASGDDQFQIESLVFGQPYEPIVLQNRRVQTGASREVAIVRIGSEDTFGLGNSPVQQI